MEKLSTVAKTIAPSSIQQLSFLAQRRNAINLAMGFPDFPAPAHIKNAAVSAINSYFNQYRQVQGICEYVALKMKEEHAIDVNPLTDIVICCGQSGAFAATMFAIIDPGDEVILFDPSYETYDMCIRLAGGVPVYVGLDPPYWTLNSDKLEKAFTDRTKALVLNGPHNPTGKVFTKDELQIIAGACRRRDVLAVTDEDYESKRDCVLDLLGKVGFKIISKPQGSLFVFAELPESCPLSDVEFVGELIKQAGVMAVPGSGFFHANSSADHGSPRYIRFAFCKSDETLAAASAKINGLVDATGYLKLF